MVNNDSSADLSGVTRDDELLLYSTVSTASVSFPKLSTSYSRMERDFQAALDGGEHLLLAFRNTMAISNYVVWQ